MTVNIQKTKFMVVGSGIEDEDLPPIVTEGGEIEDVKEFSYLCSLIAENGRIYAEVDKSIANASKAFGALHQAVFKEHLSASCSTLGDASHFALSPHPPSSSCPHSTCNPSTLLVAATSTRLRRSSPHWPPDILNQVKLVIGLI